MSQLASKPLKQYLEEIKSIIESSILANAWIECEIAASDRKSNGHCYLELVQIEDSKEVARVRATIWKFSYETIEKKFYNITGSKIKPGIKVKLQVQARFSPLYAFSLNITDVDPTFTLGDVEANKLKILKQLESENKSNLNRTLPIPIFFTHIAVISSKEAAGLQDFNKEAHVLADSGLCGFDYYYCSVQGTDTEVSVIDCLKQVYRIQQSERKYDAVVIMRGGGSVMDLNWFNNYKIANAVCQMNLPVFIGIGHEKDKTVLDLVANKSFDTPSKVILHIENTIITSLLQAQKNINLLTQYAAVQIDKWHGSITHILSQLFKDVTYNYMRLENSVQTNISSTFNFAEKAIAEISDSTVVTIDVINDNSLHCITNIKQAINNNLDTIFLFSKNNMHTLSTNVAQTFNTISYDAENNCIRINTKLNNDIIYIQQSTHYQFTIIDNQMKTSLSTITTNAQNSLSRVDDSIKSLLEFILANSVKSQLNKGYIIPLSGNNVVHSAKEAQTLKNFELMFNDGNITVQPIGKRNE